MFYLEFSFVRVFFAIAMQVVCLLTAIFGIIYAGEETKWSGVIRFLSSLAISFVWLIVGTAILPCFSFSHSLGGLAAYTLWGTLGIVPFILPLLKVRKNENPLNWHEMILGVVTVLLFCGALAVVLYYQCVTNGVLVADKLFREENLNTICCFFILPVIFFFTPVFSISALISGTLREKFSGFLKNLLLLAVAPIGFLIFTGTTLWQLNKIHSGETGSTLAIFSTAAGWVIFMIIPYGSMLWRGKKEKDKAKFHNGIAGIWAVNFFIFGLCLLGYICRGR